MSLNSAESETCNSILESTLTNIGLSNVEATVYQVALSLGSRPASIIAKKAGLKRGHTYNVLRSLAEKGMVQEFVKNSVTHFTCSPPTSLVTLVEHEENKIAKKGATAFCYSSS